MSKEPSCEDDVVSVRVTIRDSKDLSQEQLEERMNAEFDEFVKTATVTRRESSD
ncbi:hypothetical protein [Enterobacter hormaechei]|uniref:hypothetical protein n=1 Tax=Enterobacter hormaechei TaxID=158836 RepID=UPI0007A8424F|nr:Uncharacterised protein [Enterobacter hormaechei]HCR0068958.1 hypothetical protein [Enterobacter hormaechei]